MLRFHLIRHYRGAEVCLERVSHNDILGKSFPSMGAAFVKAQRWESWKKYGGGNKLVDDQFT